MIFKIHDEETQKKRKLLKQARESENLVELVSDVKDLVKKYERVKDYEKPLKELGQKKRKLLKQARESENLVELVSSGVRDLVKKYERVKDYEKPLKEFGNKYKDYSNIIVPAVQYYLNIKGLLPIRIVGLGKAGVGKTEILVEIFTAFDPRNEEFLNSFRERIDEDPNFNEFKTSSAGAGTLSPYDVLLNIRGFKVLVTDIVGFGGSDLTDSTNIEKCKEIVDDSGFIYYVFNGSVRDYGNDKAYMDLLFKDLSKDRLQKVLIIVNQIDRMNLTKEEIRSGEEAWDKEYNQPSEACMREIDKRINYDVKPILKNYGIKDDQIIYCSAVRGYNIDLIADKMANSADDSVKIAIRSALDKLKQISSINYATSTEKEKILKMDKYQIEAVLREKGLNKGLKKMYQKRLEELHRTTIWEKMKQTKIVGFPFKIFRDKIESLRFNERTFERSEGLKIRREIFEELAQYLGIELESAPTISSKY